MDCRHDAALLSPLDTRYRRRMAPLGELLGERALASHRLRVECRYLRRLCETPGTGIRKLSHKDKQYLESIPSLTHQQYTRILKIENEGVKGIPPTRHDVKAVEYFLKERLSSSSLKDIKEYVHFGLTSEDVNNAAYALMLRDAVSLVLLPRLRAVLAALDKLAAENADAAMLARTHGQPAVPTTFGKEMRVFHARLARQERRLSSARLSAKLNGAVGNYSAHAAAFPKVDWERFSRAFVESFNDDASLPALEWNSCTTQIEPHDSLAELFDILKLCNTIALGLSQDMWRYISHGVVAQKAVAGAIGSSTMPQKVNPIDFENAEGNLGLANAMFAFFAEKLPVSRLQRDLSDSTVLRNVGVAFGHTLLAWCSLEAGLGKIAFDRAAALAELDSHPEVVAEGIQTILRREGISGAYELLYGLTRGRKAAKEDFDALFERLGLPSKVRAELAALSPRSYTGLAAKLAKKQHGGRHHGG